LDADESTDKSEPPNTGSGNQRRHGAVFAARSSQADRQTNLLN